MLEMTTIHRLTVYSKCPNNGDTDTYQVEIIVRGPIPLHLERVLNVVQALTEEPTFQEELTFNLACELDHEVRTIGSHLQGKVTTECVARPSKGER